MKTNVIYHKADYDGIFCREIAKKFLPDANLIGWDYGDPVPTPDVVSADDPLYMLDISVEGLMGHPHLIWIDHHKSAIEKFDPKIPGYRISYEISVALRREGKCHRGFEKSTLVFGPGNRQMRSNRQGSQKP